MIKFFRKIRRNLLSEGKTEKYLKYAIGEIFLVVIGILIALQINNWNEDRKQNKRSSEYHQRIHEDLARLIDVSEDVTDNAEKILRSITRTVELLESGTIETEEDKSTVDFAMIWFSRTAYQLPELATYEEMKSNGDLNLIHNVTLRNRIASFNNSLRQVETVIVKLSNAIENDFQVFNKYLRSHVDPESLEVSYSYDFDKMASDQIFINTFSRLSYHWRGYVFFMQSVNRRAKGLATELTNEIGDRVQLSSGKEPE